MKHLLILSLSLTVFFACNNNQVGGECRYTDFRGTYILKNTEKINDSVIAVRYEASGKKDNIPEDVYLEISDIINIKNFSSIEVYTKKGRKYILKGERITKGSCIPYQIYEIEFNDQKD